MKFGVLILSDTEDASKMKLDNKNDIGEITILKELKNIKVAFQLLESDESLHVGSTKNPYHFIFDVKFNLIRKGRLVAGGHCYKDVPPHLIYLSVASRESVRIGLLLATLNGLEISACDIGNAYLNASNRGKVYMIVGEERFGAQYEGKRDVIVKALYGLKSARVAWRAMFAHCIKHDFGYTPCITDQDVLMKPKIRPYGSKYYAYLIVYVDDVLSIDINPNETIASIFNHFRIKKGSIGSPNIYLRANIKK